MTFVFAQPLKLLAIGGSLITSTSLWFFRPHDPLPFQTRTSSSSSPKLRVLEDDDNINLFKDAPKLANYSPPVSKFDAQIISPQVKNNPKEITFTHDDKQKKLDYTQLEKIDHFQLGNIMGLVSQYKEISKESIKIYLFKNPAWFSSTNADEFETTPLSTKQIEELFTGVDETKTKQLLLSLYKNREWYQLQEQNNITQYIARIPHLSETFSPSKLTSLKVKYFDNFDSLKDYVHKKVKESCTDDFEACIAHPDELTFLQADSLKYFPQ